MKTKITSLLLILGIGATVTLSSCSDSSANQATAEEKRMMDIVTDAGTDSIVSHLEHQLVHLQEENQRCKKDALKEFEAARLEEFAANAAFGLSKLNFSMLTSFATNDSDVVSGKGLIEAVDGAHNGMNQSPISTPRSSLGHLLPSLSDNGWLSQDGLLALKNDFRNPQRVNKFWDSNKNLVITVLRATGKLGVASAHANELLKYYEGRIDQGLAAKCKAYYAKHKDAKGFEFDSPEYTSLANIPEDAGEEAINYWFGPHHAALQNWLFVQRNRDAGGEALIKAHIRVLKDLANPV